MNDYVSHLTETSVVSVADVAKRLGVQVHTVYKWRQRGLFPEPDVKGKPALWRWSLVEEWARETGRL